MIFRFLLVVTVTWLQTFENLQFSSLSAACATVVFRPICSRIWYVEWSKWPLSDDSHFEQHRSPWSQWSRLEVVKIQNRVLFQGYFLLGGWISRLFLVRLWLKSAFGKTCCAPIFEFLLVVTVMWLQRCWNFVTIHLLVSLSVFIRSQISFRIWAGLSPLWLTIVVSINIGHSGHGWQSPKYLQSYYKQQCPILNCCRKYTHFLMEAS